jgi:hypothetical protein
MQVFKLADEAEFNPAKHVEKILGRIKDGDFTVACWEPGQISPYHCHPHATEIYFCFTGGGVMRTPRETIDVKPGALSCIRRARCTNMPTDPNARCCFASATGSTCAPGISSGAAGRGGRKAPTTLNITGRIRSALESAKRLPVILRWPQRVPIAQARWAREAALEGCSRGAGAVHPSRLALLAPQDDGSLLMTPCMPPATTPLSAHSA